MKFFILQIYKIFFIFIFQNTKLFVVKIQHKNYTRETCFLIFFVN